MKFRFSFLIAIIVLPIILMWKIYWGDGIDINTYREQLGYINFSELYFAKEPVAWVLIWIANVIDSDKMAVIFSMLIIILSFTLMGLNAGLAFTLALLSVPGILFTNNVMRQGAAALFIIVSNVKMQHRFTYNIFSLLSHNSSIMPILIKYVAEKINNVNNKLISVFVYIGFCSLIVIFMSSFGELILLETDFKYTRELDGDTLAEAMIYFAYYLLLIFINFILKSNKDTLRLNLMISGILGLLIFSVPVWISVRIIMYFCLALLFFIYLEILSMKKLLRIRIKLIGVILIMKLMIVLNLVIASRHGGAWSILWN